MNFVVLSSSRGTTFQAVIEAMAAGELEANCLGLVTDAPDRQCIEKAEAAGLPHRVVDRVKGEERELLDRKVDSAIRELMAEAEVDQADTIIAEMGWMWIHTPWFIRNWPGRILNVHPALLPKHGGKGMYGHHVHQAVLDAGEQETGVSIHVMDEGVDTGTVLLQKTCPVEPGDTVETLQTRVQALEREWYPQVLQMIATGEIVL